MTTNIERDRFALENQPVWGPSNKLTFELRDWMVAKGLIPDDQQNPEINGILVVNRDNETFIAVRIPDTSHVNRARLMETTRGIAALNEADYRVVVNRFIAGSPAKAVINTFPPEFSSKSAIFFEKPQRTQVSP